MDISELIELMADLGGEISDSQINMFLSKLKLSMPSDYMGFFLQNNGGYLGGSVKLSLPKSDGEVFETPLDALLGIRDDMNHLSIEEFWRDFQGTPLESCMPFASDCFGNTFIFVNKEEALGAVEFVNHENIDVGEGVPIADSFAEFVSLLIRKD